MGDRASADDAKRVELITEAVRLFQRIERMGLPAACSSRPLRELVYFLWECRDGLRKEDRPTYRSAGAVGKRRAKGALVYDHAVPMKLLLDQLLGLNDPTGAAVREVLDRHSVVVLITKEDDARLSKAGLRSSMPKDWNGSDPLARYEAVGITVVANERTSTERDE